MSMDDALAALRKDTCTISRNTAVKGLDKITALTYAPVYTDVPCRLSNKSYSRPTQAQGESASIRYDAVLFTRPAVDIQAGDRITVTISASGVVRYYTAGEPMLYPSSLQTGLRRTERA